MNLNEVTTQLETLPDKIRTAELAQIEAKGKLDDAELAYDVKLAFETLASQEGNAQGKKAEALANTREEKMNVLMANLEYEKKKAEFNYLTNQFISVRKIASLLEKTYAPEASGF